MEILGGLGRREERISVKGIDAFLLSEPLPGHESGGDVQYASMCAAGRISRFAVADVSGHGDAVAEFGVGLRDLMRRFINTPNQERMVQALNREMGELVEHGIFATFVIMTWFDPTRQAFICSAGHPDPLWYSAELDQWMALSPSAFKRPSRDDASRMVNLPLGIIDGTEYEQFTVPIGDGDFIVLYTDHYIEARSSSGEMLGVDGLRKLAAECGIGDAGEFGRHLEAKVAAHLGSMPIEDDRSLLVIRFDPGIQSRLSWLDRIRGMFMAMVPASFAKSRVEDLTA